MTTAASQDNAPWTIGRILGWSKGFLEQKGSQSARLDAEILLAEALELSRVQLYVQFDRPLTGDEKTLFRSYLQRRGAGEPVAYITGVRDFMGRSFRVGPDVLIPRPETELLVEMALPLISEEAGVRILDVGTGTGCIALSLAWERPQAEIHAWDRSLEAIKRATHNAQALPPRARPVSFHEVDALDPHSWLGEDSAELPELPELFDMIVSNPPYVTDDEMALLPRDVGHYEPVGALCGGVDGLDFYRAFAKHSPARLAEDGWLLCEIGASQGETAREVFVRSGWRQVEIQLDYAGHPRLLRAKAPLPTPLNSDRGDDK